MNQIQRTAEAQSQYVYSETISMNKVVDQAEGTFHNEVDFMNVLKGAASFIRLRSSEDMILEFKHPELASWVEFREGLRDDVPLLVTNEGWTAIRFQGTQRSTVVVYASRVPEADRGD